MAPRLEWFYRSLKSPLWFCVSITLPRRRDDGKRFVVRADEKLTAFLELESTMRATS
jgi:hypothetical protein